MTEDEFNQFSNEIKYKLAHKFPSAPGFAALASKLKTGKKKFTGKMNHLLESDIKQAVREWVEDPVKALETYADIADWDTREVTDMSGLFEDMKDFDEDISRWDVSKVEKMSQIFKGATSFNKECIKSWSSGLRNKKFTNEELKQAVVDWCDDSVSAEVFYGHISGWDVSEVRDMSRLFQYMEDFNDDISRWDVSNAQNMERMFENAKVFNQDISSWNTANATPPTKPRNMYDMFRGADAFNRDYIKDWANKPPSLYY